MKRRWMILIPIVILIIFAAGMNILTSERFSVPYIQKFLHNKYERSFQYIEKLPSNEPGQYYYLFATNDEKKLHFKVEYWIGPERNPLGGEFSVYPKQACT